MSIKTKCSCRFTVPWHRIHAQGRDASAAGTGRWGWGRCGGSTGSTSDVHVPAWGALGCLMFIPGQGWERCLHAALLRIRERLPGLGLSPHLSGFRWTRGVKICWDSTKMLACPRASWRQTKPGCRFRPFKANILQGLPPPDCLLTPCSSDHYHVNPDVEGNN